VVTAEAQFDASRPNWPQASTQLLTQWVLDLKIQTFGMLPLKENVTIHHFLV
jgi:hypothetical protein